MRCRCLAIDPEAAGIRIFAKDRGHPPDAGGGTQNTIVGKRIRCRQRQLHGIRSKGMEDDVWTKWFRRTRRCAFSWPN